MKAKKYMKLPVVIEAIQWLGGNAGDVFDFMGFSEGLEWNCTDKTLKIPTLEGIMTANVGDYIIRGVSGEYYPCKPEIFEITYKEVYEHN